MSVIEVEPVGIERMRNSLTFAGRFSAYMKILAIFALGLALGPALGQTTDNAASQPMVSAAGSMQNTVASNDEYRLGTGDKVQVTVYGEEDLSGPFDIDGSGNVRLPLIGQVRAAGLTVKELEIAVEQKLSKGMLVNPRVSVAVTNYRPFSILGEVNKPGEYPYENGMTVLNAVAIGGGYTYRANDKFVFVRRKGALSEQELPADDRTRIYPGDTVRIEERIF
jgi:polysaccharide export outer membrane protein